MVIAAGLVALAFFVDVCREAGRQHRLEERRRLEHPEWW
jgi:hypothetical protein